MTRRDLLGVAPGLLTARAALGANRSELLTEVYIWLEIFVREKRSFEAEFDRIFSEAKQAGFRKIELSDVFFSERFRARTLKLLKQHGLESPICYHGGKLHEKASAEQTLATTSTLADSLAAAGGRAINFNPDPKPGRERKTDDELKVQAESLNRLGDLLRQRHISLFVHNHDAEMTEDAREWRSNLHYTDPSAVSFCLDLHWVFRGGQDPLALLKESGTRTASLHIRNSRNKVWMEELGPGDIDYRAIASWLARSDLHPYLVVELAYDEATAVTRSLSEDLARSRAYAERVFKRLLA